MPVLPDKDKAPIDSGNYFNKDSATPMVAPRPARDVIPNAIDHSLYDEENPEPGQNFTDINSGNDRGSQNPSKFVEMSEDTTTGQLFNIAIKMRDLKEDDLSSIMKKIKLVKQLKFIIPMLEQEAQEGKEQILALLQED